MLYSVTKALSAMVVRRRKDSGAWEVSIPRPGQAPLRKSSSKWSRADAVAQERVHEAPLHTLEDGLERWRKEYATFLRAPKKYDTMVELLRPVFRGRSFSQAQDVASLMRRMWPHLAPATLNRRLAVLRRVCNLAFKEWDWVDQPIGKKIRLLKEDNERHYYLNRAQVERLRMACTLPEAGNLIVLAAFTGLRLSELLAVRASDLHKDELHIRRSKSGKPRVLPLHPRALHIAQQLPYVNITKQVLRTQWVKARTHCAMEHIHFHDLRHTFASWCAQAQVDLRTLKELMGHKTIQMTTRYAHLYTDNLRAAVNKI